MKYILIISFLLPLTAFGQIESDTCNWNIPNTITMDCKNGNDYQFQISCNCNVQTYELKIFNRWGEMLFQSNDPDEFWDASEFPEGVYVFTLQGEYYPKEEYSLAGNITLIK